jgi:HK97 family phage major capsid protein
MKIDTRGLAVVMEELNGLDHKDVEGTISKQEQRRRASLMSQAAAIRSGVKLKDILRSEHNEISREAGLPEFEPEPKESKAELRAKAWQQVLQTPNGDALNDVERRDMTEGVPLTTQIGTYSGLGFFVPTNFLDKVFATMSMHDALFDEDVVTLERTKDGRPFPIPLYSDITNVATVITESSNSTETDIAAPNHAVVGAYTYRSPRFVVSIEALQDVNSINLTVKNIFRAFASDRFARGLGKDLTVGKVGGPTGLIPSILTAGCPVVIAAGSSGNDGSANTGANSIGTIDLYNMMKQLNPAYLASPKCRFLMNWSTWLSLANLSNKQGEPLLKAGGVLSYDNDGVARIYGVKVAIAPSMGSIGASVNTVVLGDFSYWLTRLVDNTEDGPTGIAIYKEAPGYAENGKVGLRAFFRGDGTLLYNGVGDASATCPFVLLQQHS